MNKTNILALADFIESAKYQFDMVDPAVRFDCGSAGCIGGHAAVLWEDIREPRGRTDAFVWNYRGLETKLGISMHEHDQLCFMKGFARSLLTVTRAQAVAALRKLAETGRVEW